MATCLIGLGANLGDRAAQLRAAIDALESPPTTRVQKASALVETAPLGGPAGQSPFLNAAVLVDTSLSPERLLPHLKRIEQRLGRHGTSRWDARLIDLDLLLYDRQIRRSEALTLPHPRMAWRRFVLNPAAEIAPAMIHPELGWSIHEMRLHYETAVPYFAVVSSDAGEADRWTGWIAGRDSTVRRLPSSPREATDWNAVSFDHNRQGWLRRIRHAWHAMAATVEVSFRDGRPMEPAAIVTPFWLGAAGGDVSVHVTASQGRRLADDIQRVATADPKLLIYIESSPRTTHLIAQRELRRRVRRYRGGPKLMVDASRASLVPRAQQEVAAAVDGMLQGTVKGAFTRL